MEVAGAVGAARQVDQQDRSMPSLESRLYGEPSANRRANSPASRVIS